MSADARPRGSAARGRLRIYLGYAPGAGTTCALLSEGRRRAEDGTDVVVATAETHGRPNTEDLLAGLEVIPSAKVPYRGTLAAEMDLGAVLARGPAVALVDDVAHRNAPGSRHRARWQDVEDLLAAGIDVISTVNVGHLDSLADVVAKITGAAPRQSVPDPVVRAAGEVELVDVGPAATSTRQTRWRRRWVAGSRQGTCRRCASWPCGGWPPRWPATRGGTVPVAAMAAAVRPGSGWWSRSAVARRARP